MSETISFWPPGFAGAVSLTFDDGLDTQLDHALPLLDRHGLKGTFYLNPGHRPVWERQVPRWQGAAASGHEIGNHTARHPCSCNFRFHPSFCLEKLSLEDMAATIDQAEVLLDELFPGQKGRRSFCYPCYQSYVGAGLHRQSYVPVVAGRFRAARGGGEQANDPFLIDLSYTWAQDVRGYSGAQLIAYVEAAASQGHWAILCMHGVGGEHLSIATEAFAELVEFLARQRDRLWTDTVINLADYIIKRRQEIGATGDFFH
jgi:peptidoglycan/xylan/chitin deacetylase (PgdA/CDA1 family)